MQEDELYMQRALQLAETAIGYTSPNPMVGCVIVHQGKIIGEGFHRCYGQAHAEINAMESVKDKSLLSQSTMYVTLEPCSHYGKTPPCADAIINAHIPKVVIAAKDTNAKVSGQGISRLIQAGTEVKLGILERQAQWMNRRFFTFHNRQRPYIILKWAQTADGYMDINTPGTINRQSYWITNNALRYKVHSWRAEESAIFCGANTLKNDNPRLNVRYVHGKQPIRISYLHEAIDPELHFFDGSQPSWVFTSAPCKNMPNVITYTVNPCSWITDMLGILHQQSVLSIIIEGGASVLSAFLQAGLWDEIRVLTGDKYFGKGLAAPAISLLPHHEEWADKDKILYYYHG